MATFAKGYNTRALNTKNANLIHSLSGQTPTIPIQSITWIQDPTDLRGIPAIGRGVPGRIAGTNPEDITNR